MNVMPAREYRANEVCGLIDAAFAESGSQALRLFHGRGQCYQGFEYLTVDRFDSVLWAVLYREPSDEAEWLVVRNHLQSLAEAEGLCLLVQHRYERGAPCDQLRGELPEPLFALEGNWRFQLKLGHTQNTGYFMDMAPTRQWLLPRVEDKKVLNLFSYTCAFSIAAIDAGAKGVVNVDMSRSAINQGRENHRHNGQVEALDDGRVKMLAYDLFRSWKRIRQLGPYEVVIVDPPSRQRGSFDAVKDYQRVLRQLKHLTVPGSEVLVCLNAPYLDCAFIEGEVAREAPEMILQSRLEGREDFPEAEADCALKILHYQRAVD